MRFQEQAQGRTRTRQGLEQGCGGHGDERSDALLQHGLDEFVLALKIVVQQRWRDTSRRRNCAQGRGRDAAFGEAGDGGVEHTSAQIRGIGTRTSGATGFG